MSDLVLRLDKLLFAHSLADCAYYWTRVSLFFFMIVWYMYIVHFVLTEKPLHPVASWLVLRRLLEKTKMPLDEP